MKIFQSYINRAKLKLFNQRKLLARRYIKGSGLEIGALHRPLALPKQASAKYVDLFSQEQCIQKFPELNPSEITKVDYVDDGFVLSTIPKSSQDFLIANHVLEHAPNPIQVLKNWARVIKPTGILFITIPIAEKCFDKGRPITTLQHLINDYHYYQKKDLTKINQRNKKHLAEWFNISEPNIFRERNPNYVRPTTAEIEKRINETDAEQQEMHFHTFSPDSFKNLISHFTTEIEKTFKTKTIKKNVNEIVAVIRKS